MSQRPTPATVSPDFARGLISPRMTGGMLGSMSRRQALQAGGLGALGLILSGCSIAGVKQSTTSGVGARQAIAKFWDTAKQTGTLNFANWPLYLDVDEKNQNDHPSLDLFTKKTGIKVKYSEDIDDDGSYFGKIQPVLASGQGTGSDLMVITNGIYLDKLMDLDYLVALDQTKMSNFYTYASDLVKDPSYDRGNVYTMAWQSGITGIGYNKKLVGHEITSWDDLQDPALKGKIGMFGDTADLPNSAILAIGVNPENSTPADWQKAADWLKKQRPLVRKYYDQSYIGQLSKGDISASMAWSGDIFQANASGADLEFVVPKEGAAIWTDNMCIPVHAQHPRDAMTYMDFVYDPKIQALITDYVNYITPVPATQAIFKKDAATSTGDDKTYYEGLSTSPLIYPAVSDYSKLHRYRDLDPEEEKAWEALFEPIYQS
jgi:spermidine/putrescine transport system substrate-binding protein